MDSVPIRFEDTAASAGCTSLRTLTADTQRLQMVSVSFVPQLDFRFRAETTPSTLSTNASVHTGSIEGMLVEYFSYIIITWLCNMTEQFGIDS